jgi:hypothetical protein
MDLVHRPRTSVGHGPWWTDHHGQPWNSLELSLAAALVHDGLPRGGGNDEELTRVRFWASPKTERQRGDGSRTVMVGGTMMALWGFGGGVGDALRSLRAQGLWRATRCLL